MIGRQLMVNVNSVQEKILSYCGLAFLSFGCNNFIKTEKTFIFMFFLLGNSINKSYL